MEWKNTKLHAASEILIFLDRTAEAIRRDVERFKLRGDSPESVRTAEERAEAHEAAARVLREARPNETERVVAVGKPTERKTRPQ